MNKLFYIKSNLSSILSFFPDPIFNISISHKHSTLTPRIIISELSFIFISILKIHLSEPLHPSCLELSDIFDPFYICKTIYCAFPIVLIIFPLSLILNISIWVIKFTLSFHFTFEPISIIITTISIKIFAFSMP